MRKLVLAAAAIAAGPGAAHAADLVVYQPPVVDAAAYADETASDFYFSAEALALWRSSTDTVLFLDDNTGVLTSTRDLAALGMGYGARFSAGGPVVDGLGWQVGGFWAGSFGASGNGVSPTEDLYAVYDDDVTPGNLDFENSDVAYNMTLEESSSVGGLEASATYEMGAFRLFGGPRWIRYQSALGTVVYDEDGTTTYIDRVGITSTNNLIGVQAGIEGMVPVAGGVSIGGRAAVGIYANNASLDRSYSADVVDSPFSTLAVDATSSATGLATSLELSPKLAVAVADQLDLTFGANLLLLNGVDEPGPHLAGIGGSGGGGGLAADAPGFGNSVLFAGLTAGLQGRF